MQQRRHDSGKPRVQGRYNEAGRPHGAAKPRGPGRSGHRIEFIFEDKDIIVVEKPEGLSVIAPEGSRTKTLYDIVTDHIQRRNPRGRAAVVHRLDRDTSGVMVFAKHAMAKKKLMDNWNELVKERGYTAVIEGRMEGESGVFDTWLVENRAGQVYGAQPGSPGALRSITNWKLLASGQSYSLVSLSLETGRKHQIRAQLSEAGHPVAGDPRYGARSDPLGRLCLHAHLLVLEQPFTREVISFESPAPDDFLRLIDARKNQ